VKEAKPQQYMFCEVSHDLNYKTARSMEKRIQAVKDKQDYFNCLKIGYRYKRCKIK